MCVSRQLLSKGMGDKSSSEEDRSDYEGRFAGGKTWSSYGVVEGDLKATGRKAVQEAPHLTKEAEGIPASLPLYTIPLSVASVPLL